MQVISKSELLQTLKEIQCQMYRGRIDGVGAVSWFSDIVNEQTVIDAKEVVHGRWIEVRGRYVCSVCKSRALLHFGGIGQYLSPYCPNCGTKMKMEDKE